ncbi:MAG: GMC family oxidoreductase [Pirellulaceae bacterium]|nr:GMC family oxidoreductase [Pirellulaceae bacterium]
MKSLPKTSNESVSLNNLEKTPTAEQATRLDRRQALSQIASATLALPLLGVSSASSRAESPLATVTARMERRTTGSSVYKETAIADYTANMARFGGQLSSPSSGMFNQCARGVPWQFDVLIIGSGYGASVMAARLARRMRVGTRLAIIERGREWVPGTFPDTVPNMIEASRNRLFVKTEQVRNPLGLFNVRQFKEINVLSGTGLGGSSLINASVAIRPDVEVFRQSVWPSQLRDRMFLDPYYDMAECELGVAREPQDWTDKMVSQRLAAERLRDCGAHYEAAALTLTRSQAGASLPVLNRQGLTQRGCIDCGDCLNGCNVGAKNTLAMNYLPMARAAGAEIYTQTEIHHIEKCAGFYTVWAEHHPCSGEPNPQSLPVQLTARIVVLAAGSLGSTEILLRSAGGLPVSNTLGSRWTGNGDALGFIQRAQYRTGIQGFGAYDAGLPAVGPTIQTNVTYPYRPELRHRVLIQEGAATRAYVNAMSFLMHDLDLSNTQVLLGMGHDGAEGRITLDDDQARLDWPGLTDGAYRQLIREEFRKLAAAHGGDYKFLKIFGDKMISVHPLGGCGMGDSAYTGVVNHKGQVFDAAQGGDVDPVTGTPRVHTGLYVCDGAIMPTSIACNPLLTISAIAERTSELLTMEPEYQDLFEARAA